MKIGEEDGTILHRLFLEYIHNLNASFSLCLMYIFKMQTNGGRSGVLSQRGREGMTIKVANVINAENKKRGDSRFKRCTWYLPSEPGVVLLQVNIYHVSKNHVSIILA